MKVLVFAEGNHSTSYWESSLPLLSKRGKSVVFVSLRQRGDVHLNLESRGIRTFALDSISFKDYWDCAQKLATIVNDEGIEVVHACEAIPAFVTGLSAFRGNKAKRIFNRQHNIVHGKQRVLSFLASHMSDLIMPVSRSSGEAAQKYDFVRKSKIFVAYSGIESMREVSEMEIVDLRHRLGIGRAAKVVSMVARLREEKGHRTLFDACKIVASRLECPLHVVLAGDGPDKMQLMEAASRYDNFDTHFVGSQSDVALWFSVGDVVAMPSYHEAFGLSAVEAMSCCRPLVASNVGGLAEIVENEISGILVEPRNEKDLAKAILKILSSNDIAAELGRMARVRVSRRFSVDRMVDSWIQCYNFVSGTS